MSGFSDWLTNLDEAQGNKNDDTNLARDQNAKWDQDRAAFSKDWGGLLSEFGGQFDQPAIVERDGFPAMTHQQIWDALQGVTPYLINDKATAWRELSAEARTATTEFLDGVNADLEAGWNGRSATAAVEGVRTFCASMTPLAASFQMMGQGLDLIEGVLAQAKSSVGQPDNETFGDRVNNLLPDDMFKTPQYRADEAQETARWVMTTYYEPGVANVDTTTPVLPEPRKATDTEVPPGTDKPPGDGDNGDRDKGTDGRGTNSQGDTPGQENVTGEEGQSTSGETSPQNTAGSTTPESTTSQSATTTPSAVSPASTGAGSSGGYSGTPSGGYSGTSSGGSGASQNTGSPGQTVQGSPTGTSTGTSTSTSSGSGSRGSRMPGMMSPGGAGGRGGKGDDDDEHKSPDYLVYDRGSELLGTIPPALPPGGVIGG